MMKRFFAAAMIAAGMATAVSAGAMAETVHDVEVEGVAFDIPEQFKDLLTVETEGLGEGELVKVSETASLEAARAQEIGDDGAGWIFTIARLPEQQVNMLRCGGMDGMRVFAEDDDFDLILETPTDVRFVREQYDDIDDELEQFGSMNQWANEDVTMQILANNPELDEEMFTNTLLDMYLARALYKGDVPYEVRSLDFGGETPELNGENDGIEELAEDFVYVTEYDMEAPDGEYIVLSFNDNGEEVRYDFFKASGCEDLIREVRMIGDEEMETIYRSACKDGGTETTTGTMREWVNELLEGDD